MADQTSDNDPELTPKTKASLIKRALDFWHEWYVWIIGPALIGLVGVVVALGSEYASHLNRVIREMFPYAPFLLLPAGFAFMVFLTTRFFPGTQGSGIPQAIAVVEDPDDGKTSNLLSIRILIGKVMMLFGGFFVGASIGREGPTVQIGASIMHAFYGRGVMLTAAHRRMLVIAGGAAGIAAAFNTPLAGIMFAIEELTSKRFKFAANTTTIMTVIVAGLISLALVGNYTYFNSTDAVVHWATDAGAIILCGVVGGAFGGLFSRIILSVSYRRLPTLGKFVQNYPYYFAAACGLGVALLGLLTDGMVFGSGYEPTSATLAADASMMSWYYGLAKLGATILSTLSGIPGGIFAPTLAVGAGLGDAISLLMPSLAPHGAIIVMMMAAYLAGVTRAPATSFIITMEMTSGHQMLLALMVTSLIACVVSRLISPVPLYHALAARFLPPSARDNEH